MQVNDVKYKDYIQEISTILACINMLTLYYKLTFVNTNITKSVRYTDVVQMIYDVFQYIVDLYFVYKYGAEMCFEYIKQYAFIDGFLGTDFYNSIRRRLIKIMIFYLFMWLLNSSFDYFIWANGFGFTVTTAYSIAYIYILIKILTNLDLTVNVMQVECRLRALAEIVKDCSSATESAPGMNEDITKRDWFYHEGSRESGKPKFLSISIVSCLDRQQVRRLSRCYLLLTEQVTFINKMYGMRILMNSLSLLIDLVRFTNLTVLLFIGSQVTGYAHGYYNAITTIWRTMTCIVVITSLVDHCERVYKQRERIICLLDHLIINKNLDEPLLSAFSELRALVQSRAINFHMAHFIRIEYPLLVSIASVVVTYTIILLQSVNNN
ncbi:uncharacterized protein LOC126773933 [Nymphalis io]|uniref:uncharacterized protein LOC126773933 n=1 Tax=Inachis io TaxID=171585 RepID=UPI002166D7D3|nr:uncharacterized protein LOC126773933 [Nymphalis io]